MGCGLWSVRWLVQALSGKPNPLRRGADRIVATLVVLVIGAALMAIPVAATWGSMSYEYELQAARTAAAAKHQVDAVVTGPTEPRVVGGDAHGAQTAQFWAPATWTGRDGTARTDWVRVDPSTTAGAKVALWVDTTERITTPPQTPDQVLTSAVMGGIGAWIAMQTACIALIAAIRLIADAIAARNWGREWDVVEPTWTQRQN